MTPVVPRPAASVLLVRNGGAGVEVYMIRRDPRMRFLGGYYAFPGGKVDPQDAEPSVLARCRGVAPAEAARVLPALDGIPPLAFLVTAARELLEETGVLPAGDAAGRPLAPARAEVAAGLDRMRRRLVAGEVGLAALLEEAGWYLDVGAFRYLSHFITPPASPIRFTARFFLAPVPPGQAPRLFTEETSEGFWIEPAAGVRGWERGEMPMAEPAESGLRYLAEFASVEELWAAHADGRHKFHGILDRVAAAGISIDGATRPPGVRAAAEEDGDG